MAASLIDFDISKKQDKISCIQIYTMNDKKILVWSLLFLVGALVLYIFNSKTPVPSDNAINPDSVNQNITEPPSPVQGQNPPPSYETGGNLSAKNWWLDEIVLDGAEVSLDVNVVAALTLNIEADKKFNGFAGCNNYAGAYTSSASGEFDFGAVVSTKKYCMGSSDLEDKVFQAMEKIEAYGFDSSKNLILESKDKKTRLEFVPAI